MFRSEIPIKALPGHQLRHAVGKARIVGAFERACGEMIAREAAYASRCIDDGAHGPL
jgi:hypothetical protein